MATINSTSYERKSLNHRRSWDRRGPLRSLGSVPWGAALVLACCLCAGCTRLGTRFESGLLPEGAPSVEAILADLAAQDAAVRSVTASGSFLVESPDLAAPKRCRGQVAFVRPDALHVRGRHRLSGVTVFELTCQGSAFLLDFPTEDERFYERQGMRFGDVPFSVSPPDIAREMFFPEPWAEIAPRRVRLAEYDTTTATAVLLVGSRRRPARRVEVTGPPWRMVRHERLGKQGETYAVTEYGDYREVDGGLFPSKIDSVFPSESTHMALKLRRIRLNAPVDESLFSIDWPDE